MHLLRRLILQHKSLTGENEKPQRDQRRVGSGTPQAGGWKKLSGFWSVVEESRTLAAKLSLAARGWPKEALIPKGPGFWK